MTAGSRSADQEIRSRIPGDLSTEGEASHGLEELAVEVPQLEVLEAGRPQVASDRYIVGS